MKLARVVCSLLSLAAAAPVAAEMVAKPIDYTVDGTKVQSVLVYDDSVAAKRPGLVMAPNWMGLNDVQVAKAKTIAGKDYVVLVADVYGVDLRPKNPTEAGAAAKSMYGDAKTLRARINAALAQLKGQAGKAPLDGKHYGAIGFCFGGATVLELARSGADIAGVATFHGSLGTKDPTLPKDIKAKVLAMNGADDKFVSADEITGFEKEMSDAKVDWQFVNFGGAVHCFAEPDADNTVPGCLYHERVAKRSFALMHDFFDEAFAK